MIGIDKKILSARYPISLQTRRGRDCQCYIQRVESSLYYDLGFDKYHYLDGALSRGSLGLLIYSRRLKPLAFVVLRNQTFKGCSNAMMVSRFVIFPAFQHRGLSTSIIATIGGMLKSRNMRLFINTHIDSFGNALGNCGKFKSTSTDRVKRSNTKDAKCKNRQGGIAYRKEYCGEAILCHNVLFTAVNILRERRSKAATTNEDSRLVIDNIFAMLSSFADIVIAICNGIFSYDLFHRAKILDKNEAQWLQYG